MVDSGHKGLMRIVKATQYSWQGIRAAYRHEEAFRQESWLCLVLLPLGFYLGDVDFERIHGIFPSIQYNAIVSL